MRIPHAQPEQTLPETMMLPPAASGVGGEPRVSRGTMDRRLLAIAALALLSPLASGQWAVHGTLEPDTSYDRDSGFMWLERDVRTDGARPRVYFNAVGNFYSTGVNPNTDLTGSRVHPFPFQNVGAYLGVWKDCNDDGYIGMAAGSLTEYRAELLSSPDICPSLPFNDGEWVYEFLWVTSAFRPTERASPTLRSILDREALVWGDRGLPGAVALPFEACDVFYANGLTPVATMPYHGSTSSTGGALRYADCWAGHNVARTVNDVDFTGQLRFEDPERPDRSSSMLNQPLPVSVFGVHDDTGDRDGVYDRHPDAQERSAFTVWDCSAPRGTADVRDPTGPSGRRGELSVVDARERVPESQRAAYDAAVARLPATARPRPIALADGTGSYTSVPAVAASADPQGNVYTGANATERGVGVTNDAAGTTLHRAPCAEQRAPTRAVVDTTHPPVEGPPPRDAFGFARHMNDYTFGFLKHQTDALHVARNTTGQPLYPLGRDAPTSLGTDAARFTSAVVGPGWFANGPRTQRPPVMDRRSLEPGAVVYETFYARVGSATLAVADVPTDNVYGAEWCLGATTGVVGRFDCDASRWWDPTVDPYATYRPDSDADGIPEGALPGIRYHLRDVDCRDDGLTADGATSPGALTGRTC